MRTIKTFTTERTPPSNFAWHGRLVSTEVDGAAEEGTPFHPAAGQPQDFVRA